MKKEVSIEPSLRKGKQASILVNSLGIFKIYITLKVLKLHRLLKREGMTSGTDKAK
jgi:hypothetical protein